MTGRRWVFRPGWAPTLATAVLLPVLLALGQWQLDRAAAKDALLEQAAARAGRPPLRLATGAAPPRDADVIGRRVIVRGRWLPERQVLLDNRILRGRAGYAVFTPLRIAGGDRYLLVNRGWVATGPHREAAPDVRLAAREIEVGGIAAPPPAAGWHVPDAPDRSLDPLLRVQRLDMAALASELGLDLLPWTLRLEPAAFEEEAGPAPGMAPERHRAYAVQWFLLAAVLAALYLGLNLRRRPPPAGGDEAPGGTPPFDPTSMTNRRRRPQ